MHAKGWPGISRDDRETREEGAAKGGRRGAGSWVTAWSRTLAQVQDSRACDCRH